jgi:site-specific recombinase XerD
MIREKQEKTKIEELAKNFFDYLLIEKNRAQRTKINYEHYIRRFLDYSKVSKPEHITLDTVRAFRIHLHETPGAGGAPLKKQTQIYHLIALRNFLKYLAKRDIRTLSAEKIELGKMPSRSVQFMEADELDRLRASPTGTTLRDLRDKALLETLFSTGVRVSELASLNRNSIDFSRGEFTVNGKGNKFRVVFLSERAKELIGAYLKKREDIDDALFIRIPRNAAFHATSDLRMTPRSIERLIKKYSAKAGIAKKVTPHSLRHQFATDLLRNGADIRSVQALLGHSHITTTQIYTHITDAMLREVHKKFHDKRRS